MLINFRRYHLLIYKINAIFKKTSVRILLTNNTQKILSRGIISINYKYNINNFKQLKMFKNVFTL